MKTKSLYLVLCVAGTVLPYWQFLPWVAVHGLNWSLLYHDLFANRISAFFGMDVVVSAIALLAFVRNDKPRLSGPSRWLPLMSVLIVGVSLGLPLYLYLRERQFERVKPIPDSRL